MEKTLRSVYPDGVTDTRKLPSGKGAEKDTPASVSVTPRGSAYPDWTLGGVSYCSRRSPDPAPGAQHQDRTDDLKVMNLAL